MVNLRFGLNEAEIISYCLKLKSYVKIASFLFSYIDDLTIIRQCIKECLELGDVSIISNKSYSSFRFFRDHHINKLKDPEQIKKVLKLYCCRIKRLIKKLKAHRKKFETWEKYKEQEDVCTEDPRILLLLSEERGEKIFKDLADAKVIPSIDPKILFAGHIKCTDTITPYNPEYRHHRIRILEDKINLLHFFFLAKKNNVAAGKSRMLNKLLSLHFETSEGKPLTSMRQTFYTIKEKEKDKIFMKMKNVFMNIINEALET